MFQGSVPPLAAKAKLPRSAIASFADSAIS